MNEPDEARAEVQKIQEAIGVILSLNEAVPALDRRTRHNRRLLRVAVTGLVVDVLLTVGLGLTAVKTYHDEQTSNSSICQAGNNFRQADKERWEFLLHLSVPRTQTPAEKALTNKFVNYINAADTPKKC